LEVPAIAFLIEKRGGKKKKKYPDFIFFFSAHELLDMNRDLDIW
jgi:hypothetical protein